MIMSLGMSIVIDNSSYWLVENSEAKINVVFTFAHLQCKNLYWCFIKEYLVYIAMKSAVIGQLLTQQLLSQPLQTKQLYKRELASRANFSLTNS